jgi:hypothetical protein
MCTLLLIFIYILTISDSRAGLIGCIGMLIVLCFFRRAYYRNRVKKSDLGKQFCIFKKKTLFIHSINLFVIKLFSAELIVNLCKSDLSGKRGKNRRNSVNIARAVTSSSAALSLRSSYRCSPEYSIKPKSYLTLIASFYSDQKMA